MPRIEVNGAGYEVFTWKVKYAADNAPPIDGSSPPADALPGWVMDIISDKQIPGLYKGRKAVMGWPYGSHIFGARGVVTKSQRGNLRKAPGKVRFIYEIFSEEQVKLVKRRDLSPLKSVAQLG